MSNGPIPSRLRKNYSATAGIQRPARLGEEKHPIGCSKRPAFYLPYTLPPESAKTAFSPRDAPCPSKAAGESKPEAYPDGHIEDFNEPRTKQADFFSILGKGSYLARIIHEASTASADTQLRRAVSPFSPSTYYTSMPQGFTSPSARLASRLHAFATNRHE
jgi:hypothetical protein